MESAGLRVLRTNTRALRRDRSRGRDVRAARPDVCPATRRERRSLVPLGNRGENRPGEEARRGPRDPGCRSSPNPCPPGRPSCVRRSPHCRPASAARSSSRASPGCPSPLPQRRSAPPRRRCGDGSYARSKAFGSSSFRSSKPGLSAGPAGLDAADRGAPGPEGRRRQRRDLRRAPRTDRRPASAAQGGHAPVVAHLEECAACRSAARDYAALDRLIRPATPSGPTPDLEARLRQRLTARPGSARRSAWLLAGAVAVLALAAFAAPRLLRGPKASSAPSEPSPPHGPPPGPRAPAPRPRGSSAGHRRRTFDADLVPDASSDGTGQVRGGGAPRLRFSEFVPDARPPRRILPEPVGPRAPLPIPAGGFRRALQTLPMRSRVASWTGSAPRRKSANGSPASSRRWEPPRRRTRAPRGPLEVRSRFQRGPASGASPAREPRGRTRCARLRATRERDPADRPAAREERVARWRSLSFAKPLTGQELESAERLLL